MPRWIEARIKHGATIFCAQRDTDGIVHNAYTLSMRERHGLHRLDDGGDGK